MITFKIEVDMDGIHQLISMDGKGNDTVILQASKEKCITEMKTRIRKLYKTTILTYTQARDCLEDHENNTTICGKDFI